MIKVTDYRLINLSNLARLAGISKTRLHMNLNGTTDTLTENERTHMANFIYKEANRLLDEFGFQLGPIKRHSKGS